MTTRPPSLDRPVPVSPAPERLHRRRRWRRALVVLLVIVWLGALTATHVPAEKLQGINASDKTLHLAGYAALGSLLWLVLATPGRSATWRVITVVVALAVYGAIDEYTQPWFNRFASLHDWYFDCLGAILAAGVLETLRALLVQKRKSGDAGDARNEQRVPAREKR